MVSNGVVTEAEVDPLSSTTQCTSVEWTVEQLHEMIAGWLDDVSAVPSPEFGEHKLNVRFNDIGVPAAMEFDLANGDDEEHSMRVSFTPIQ